MTRPHFRADIEGLRAVAILAVVAFHAALPGIHGGFVGVDVFYVLSGYLITGLLVRELIATGRIDMGAFYARRIRRLLPAACLMLGVTVVLGMWIFSPLEQTIFTGTAIATALYISNIYFAKTATDYLADDADLNPLLHTWSLAVEEQFYLCWPALTMLVFRRSVRPMRALTLAFWAVTIVSLCGSIWLTGVAQPWAFFSAPTRAWEFGIGALAFVHFRGERRLPTPLLQVAGWAGVLGLLWSVVEYNRQTPFPGSAALLPALATALLLVVGGQAPTATTSRFLSTAPMRWLGRISYSWYLWHWPVLVLASSAFGPLSLAARLFWAVASLGVAVLAYRLVEDPLRRSAYLAARNVRTLRLGMALTGACAVLGVGWLLLARDDAAAPNQRAMTAAHDDIPIVYQDGCHLDFFATQSPECVFGDTASSRKVVLFGDSHAAQWFPALDMIAQQKHLGLLSLTKSGCPAADVPLYAPVLQRPYRECEEWREATLARIIRTRPAAVFISNANSYVASGVGFEKYAVSATTWIAGIDRVAVRLRSAGIPVVIIADSPSPQLDIPTCLSRAVWRGLSAGHECSTPRIVALRDRLITLIERATRMDARSVDFDDALCTAKTCPPQIGGRVVYRDGNHLTASFAASFAPAMLREMNGAARR